MKTEAEKEAEIKLKDFAQTIGNDPNVDRAALAMAALNESQNADRVTPKKRRTAYVISFSVPPFGLLFGLYYYFSRKTDGKRVALMCVILTLIGGGLVWLSLKSLTSMVPGLILGPTGSPALEQQMQFNGQEIQINGQRIRLNQQPIPDELKDLLQ